MSLLTVWNCHISDQTVSAWMPDNPLDKIELLNGNLSNKRP